MNSLIISRSVSESFIDPELSTYFRKRLKVSIDTLTQGLKEHATIDSLLREVFEILLVSTHATTHLYAETWPSPPRNSSGLYDFTFGYLNSTAYELLFASSFSKDFARALSSILEIASGADRSELDSVLKPMRAILSQCMDLILQQDPDLAPTLMNGYCCSLDEAMRAFRHASAIANVQALHTYMCKVLLNANVTVLQIDKDPGHFLDDPDGEMCESEYVLWQSLKLDCMSKRPKVRRSDDLQSSFEGIQLARLYRLRDDLLSGEACDLKLALVQQRIYELTSQAKWELSKAVVPDSAQGATIDGYDVSHPVA